MPKALAADTAGLPGESCSTLPSDPVKAEAQELWYGAGENYRELRQGVPRSAYNAERSHFDRLIEYLRTQVAVELLEVGQTLCDETDCDVYTPQGSLYYDTHHLNELGANRVVQGFFSK